MKDNLRLSVKNNLRRIADMPPTSDIIEAFFKILTIEVLPSADGVGIDIYKALSELYGRRKVTVMDKHVDSGILSVKFEVFLRKLYYMLNGEEIQPRNEEEHVTLANCIFAFPCLRSLRYSSSESERNLSVYLDAIRNNRNSTEGNGAHASSVLTETQLDYNIMAFATLYIYVVGMCLNELKEKYELL
jgi:type I restriction enzyme R subunit